MSTMFTLIWGAPGAVWVWGSHCLCQHECIIFSCKASMHVCMWRESLGSFPFRKTHPFLVSFKILNTPDRYNDSACIYHARDLRYIVTCSRVLYNKSWTEASWTLSNRMDANKPVKWGICGLGNISRDFCTIICSLPPEKHQVCVSYQPSLCHRAFCRVLSVQFSASKNS